MSTTTNRPSSGTASGDRRRVPVPYAVTLFRETKALIVGRCEKPN